MGVAEILCAATLALGMENADNACRHMDTLVKAAQEYNIDPTTMAAMVYIESRWTDRVRSHANACGLTQVLPRYTGGHTTGGIKYTCEQLMSNPKLSLRVGIRIFSYWLKKYARCKKKHCGRSHYLIALCGYNAGFRCKGKTPNRHGLRYARVVLGRAARMKRKIAQLRRKQQR